MSCTNSCPTFTLAGTTYTVYLTKPIPDGADNRLSKFLTRFSFWSENYDVHDEGIEGQPLMLSGIESSCSIGDTTIEFEKINYLMDEHEEITISGLGDCYNAVYVIKRFSYRNIKKTVYGFAWDLTLEKVRDS
ncbi:MAG: hypothetical protein ACFFC1_10520 [Promethearchaeota archaeon]